MKLRQGFVSNSSSSSFVVTTNAEQPLKFTMTIEVDFSKMVDEVITTEEEAEGYVRERFDYTCRNRRIDWTKYEPAKQLYDEIMEEISAGNIVHVLEVDRDSEEHAMLIHNKFRDQGLVVIHEDCY